MKHKHFTKPTNDNIFIQRGTALIEETVFSSLRQERIRRMKYTSVDINIADRKDITEEFIQVLVNSGYRFAYVRSLQDLTKYQYMMERSLKNKKEKDYMPLYREN